MKDVHIILQGKGGVGKSLVASLIAQYLQQNRPPVVCIDTDPVNATLSGYKGFDVRRIELTDGARIDERRFDGMIETVISENVHFVIDNGAASFMPLSNYLIENDAASVIADAGKRVILHTVITGGQALLDTAGGLDKLASSVPESAGIFVWLNGYFGEVAHEGKSFEQLNVYKKHKDRIAGIIDIPRRTSETFVRDVEDMLRDKLTFDEAVNAPANGVMVKQRLKSVQKDLFTRMAAAGV